MFFIPIGLGPKLPVIPFACILLCLGIFFYSKSHFAKQKEQEAEFTATLQPAHVDAIFKFYNQLCMLRTESPVICDIPEVNVEADAYTAYQDFEKKTQPKSKSLTVDGFLGHLKLINFKTEHSTIVTNPNKVVDPKVLALSSFEELKIQHKDRLNRKAEVAKKYNLLTSQNINLSSILNAVLSHADWEHLIGNLLVLLLLGVYVEARMGALLFIASFFATAITSLTTFAAFFQTPLSYLVGASGGVYGILGVFLVFFYAQPMRIWFSFLFVYNRIIYVSSIVILTILFILGDITGVLSGGGEIANGAHIVGLLTGLLIGYVYKINFPLEKDMIFPQEQKATEQLKTIKEIDKRQQTAFEILNWNPNNLIAMREYILDSIQLQSYTKELTAQFTSYLKINIQKRQIEDVLSILQQVPLEKSLTPLMQKLNLKNRLSLAASALKRGDATSAIRIYDSVYSKFNQPDLKQNILHSVEQIYKSIQSNKQMVENIQLLPLDMDLKAKLNL